MRHRQCVFPDRIRRGTRVVDTGSGPVRGAVEGPVAVWTQVPYAAPPVAASRFRAPQPPDPWTVPREGRPARPGGAAADVGAGAEASTVTVWAPATGAGPAPVLVWPAPPGPGRHAGGLRGGAAVLAARAEVVVVQVHGRAGVVGFVDFSSLSGAGRVFESNLGLRDLVAALEWVRANIAAFGGDPGNVTVLGEGAGSGVVPTLLTLPSARGLFARAVVSGRPVLRVCEAEPAAAAAAAVCARLGGVDRLAAAPAAVLDAVGRRVVGSGAPAGWPAVAVLDGQLVGEQPLAALRGGRAHRVPLLCGTDPEPAAVPSTTGPLHPAATGGFGSLAGLLGSRLAAVRLVEAHSRYAPSWLFRLDHLPPGLGPHPGWGQLTYGLGGTGPASVSPVEEVSITGQVTARLRHRWLSFARGGTPDGPWGAPAWACYDEQRRTTLVLDRHDTLVDDLDRAVRRAAGDEVNAVI